MKPPDSPSRSRPRSLALLLAGAGVAGLVLSFVEGASGLINRHDPGPWLLPRGLSLVLLCGGAGLILGRGKTPLSSATRQNENPAEPTAGEMSAAAGAVNGSPFGPWILLGSAALYVAALPWVGFLGATGMFAAGLLWFLEVAWWRALIAAAVLAFVAHGLFGLLFKVPLPAGAWN